MVKIAILVKNKETFQNACKEYAETQINNQLQDFVRLGIFGDWQNSYRSLDSKFEADIIRSLGVIFESGHLEKGEKPVHWCQDCKSSLAEAEVEYLDKTSKSIDVSFLVSDDSLEKVKTIFNQSKPESISFVIWTTTPWTIPSNVAVCINPDISYSLIEVEGKYLVIAADMFEQCMERWNQTGEKVSTVLGKEIKDINLLHPFLDRVSILLHADHVTTETGTGCVHTAPAHGLDDHVVCKKNNIESQKALNNMGLFKEEFDFIAGLPPIKADPLVIEKLIETKSLNK
jgi:isoleucyl-tRNA synthetase